MSEDDNTRFDDFWTHDAHLDTLANIWNLSRPPQDDGLPTRTLDRDDFRSYLKELKEQDPDENSITMGNITLYRQILPCCAQCVSYALPISLAEIRECDRPLITEWFSRFLDKTPVDVKRLLNDDWLSLSGVARNFADLALEYTPCAIVSDSESLWLSLKTEETSPSYLTILGPAQLTQEELAFIGQFNAPTLEVFYRYFREVSLAPNADCPLLSIKAEPVTIDELWDCGESLVGGLAIFREPSGDQMILCKDGTIWKWAHELTYLGPDQAVKMGFANFRSFVLTFIELLRGSNKAWEAFKFY